MNYNASKPLYKAISWIFRLLFFVTIAKISLTYFEYCQTNREYTSQFCLPK